MFDTVLVANRGEIALRVMRTCREMGIRTVAVCSDVDRDALHAREADVAVPLGGDQPAETYLHAGKIIEAARATGAGAIHPGYGFLAENPGFARDCAQAGIVFIGPPAGVLSRVGDKLEARQLAAEAGVEPVPGGLVASGEDGGVTQAELEAAAERIGYPIMIKAVGGGGGKGMRRVERPAALAEALERAGSEARAAFGDGRLYLERCIERPRHVEVQILADDHGRVVHLFERECSIQRRHQKIIEEAPSPAVGDELRARLGQAAVRVAEQAGYRGAGTVEFLLDASGAFWFMEVNARLQVEHPVTELITGVDLVEQQLLLAAGGDLELGQDQVTRRGHAVECRIYAEDPQQGLVPSPGRISILDAPEGPGIRFDCGVGAGSEVPVFYDPILAKLITWAADRDRAIARMRRALAETTILGVATPVEMLLDIVASEPYRSGATDTAFLERHFAGWRPDPDRVRRVLAGWLVHTLERDQQDFAQAPAETGAAAAPADPWHTLGAWRMGQKP